MHPTDLTLSEYVDELLNDSERGSLDDHLRECAQCRGLVADFREIRRAAKGLGSIEPPPQIWTRVEQVLGSTAARPDAAPQAGAGGWGLVISRWQFGGVAFAAAVIAAAIFVGFRIGQRQQSEPTLTTASDGAPSAQSIEAELQQAEEHYQKAISLLEQVANANSGFFDPATAATLQKNLSVVDQAISESRAALRAQPNSEPAQASLLDSFKAKLALLQDTVSLINEMRKGDDAAAARIVSGLKRGT